MAYYKVYYRYVSGKTNRVNKDFQITTAPNISTAKAKVIKQMRKVGRMIAVDKVGKAQMG